MSNDSETGNDNNPYSVAEEFFEKQVKVYTTNGAALTGKLVRIEGKQLLISGRHGNAYANLDFVISMTSH